jgi:hypothetical protein
MDSRLSRLIRDYQAAVAKAVALLAEGGIARPASVWEWVARDVGIGQLPNRVGYFKHGFGCDVIARDVRVDFDFRMNGEIDGFNPGWLCKFARGRRWPYGLSSEESVYTLFQRSLEAGEIVRVDFGLFILKDERAPDA